MCFTRTAVSEASAGTCLTQVSRVEVLRVLSLSSNLEGCQSNEPININTFVWGWQRAENPVGETDPELLQNLAFGIRSV